MGNTKKENRDYVEEYLGISLQSAVVERYPRLEKGRIYCHIGVNTPSPFRVMFLTDSIMQVQPLSSEQAPLLVLNICDILARIAEGWIRRFGYGG